jgi:hypothetical protein
VKQYIIFNTSRKHVNYEEDKNKVPMNKPYNIQNTAEPLETEQSEINRLVDKSKVKDFIDQQKKKSTVNCTKRDLNIVYKWLFPKMN